MICKLLLIALAVFVKEGAAQASIGETISNTSVIIGADAQFFCEVIGTQAPIGEDLTFSKQTPPPSLIISQNSNVANTSKHAVTGKYNMTVLTTEWGDEGQYDCTFGATTYTAYLVICDPPTGSSIYWGGGRSWTEQGQTNNLTCESDSSRPPATFRWYRGSTLITDAIYEQGALDANSYGKAYSHLELTPTSSDEGTEYTCYVDIPAVEAYYTQRLSVSFSGAGQAVLSMACLFLVSVGLML